jgi:hypothetical protein
MTAILRFLEVPSLGGGKEPPPPRQNLGGARTPTCCVRILGAIRMRPSALLLQLPLLLQQH